MRISYPAGAAGLIGALLVPAVPAQAGLIRNGLPVTITGPDGNDAIIATVGNEVIAALGGNDTIRSVYGNLRFRRLHLRSR